MTITHTALPIRWGLEATGPVHGKLVTIEVRADRLDVVARRGGRVLGAHRLGLEPAGDWHSWMRALEAVHESLAAAVRDLNATGAPATVFYRSPSLALDIVSLNARTKSDAVAAAELACLDANHFASEEAVSDAVVVARERGQGSRAHHVVAAADRDRVTAAVADVVAASGLRLTTIVPIDAPVIGQIIRNLLARSNGPTGVLHLGETTSFFAVASEGALRFARRIGLGLETIVRSLLHEFRLSPELAPVSLDREHTFAILFQSGIPAPDDIIDAQRGIRGSHILPLLQPALQRLLIEIRQSIRFGLTERERERLRVELRGAAGGIPGLDELLSKELDFEVATSRGAEPFRFEKIASPASDHDGAARLMRCGPTAALLPREIASRRARSRVRRWAWAGAAAALAVMAFDAVRLTGEISEARRSADMLAVEANAVEALRNTRQRLIELSAAMQQLDAAVHDEMRGADAFAPTLRELSISSPPHIRLTLISIGRAAEGAVTGAISGYALPDAGRNADLTLSAYLAALGRSPLVDSLTLRTVYSTAVDDQQAVRFEADVSLVAWPADPFSGLALIEPEAKR